MSNTDTDPIDQYLDQVCLYAFCMSDTARDAFREEVRTHLLAMVRQHEAEGMSEAEAIMTALEDFGEPKRIGKDTARTWVKKHGLYGIAEANRSQSRKVKMLRGMQIGCIAAWSCVYSSAVDDSPHFSWAIVLTLVAAIGFVLGALEPILQEASDPRFILTKELAQRSMQQEVPLLKQNASYTHRLFYWAIRGIMPFMKKSLEDSTRTAHEPQLPFDFKRLLLNMAILAVLVVLPLKGNMYAICVITITCMLTAQWIGRDITRRYYYRMIQICGKLLK